MRATFLLSLIFLAAACGHPPETPAPPVIVPAALEAPLVAHGGLDLWRSFGTLEYDFVRGESSDHQIIDLHTRRVRISNEAYTIGFDGDDVWITPDKDALDYGAGPRFYSGTYFYFFSIPFVLADPGVHQEVLPQRELDGKAYDVVRCTFGSGTGDSPGDQYIAYFDPDTHRLHLLLYTVTFGRTVDPDAEPRFGALLYDRWQTVDGLVVPEHAAYHKWEGDHLGDFRGEIAFRNVGFRPESPDEALFARPDSAFIDAMPQ